jgi:porin
MRHPLRGARGIHAAAALLISLASAWADDAPKLFYPINILAQPKITGNWGGMRDRAITNGVSITGQSVTDMLWNTSGGISTGSACAGLFQFGVEIDTAKTIGLEGGTFKNTWLWLYGRNPSSYVGDPYGVSGIAANPAFRAYELWYQQNLWNDAFSLRGGLLGLDTEFALSTTSDVFVNGSFGFPNFLSQNLANGGPEYPMATPGLRLALKPASWLTLRSALTQANPFSQDENLYNFNWNFGPSGGLLSITEAEANWDSLLKNKQLPGTAKAGFWIQNGPSPTLPEDWALAAPGTLGYCTGFYAIIDQLLYRASSPVSGKNPAPDKATPGDDDSTPVQGLSSYARFGFSPQPGSPLSLSVDSGLVYTGLIPGRSQDQLGAGFAYGQLSSGYSNLGLSQDVPAPYYSAVAELTYSIQLAPAVKLQPDLQYVIRPNGSAQYGNALVAGFRAIVDF